MKDLFVQSGLDGAERAALIVSRALKLGALSACILLTGCADWSYNELRLGMTPSEYERILPVDASRKTSLGMCCLESDKLGRTDALVVLVSEDRRIAGKLWARNRAAGRGAFGSSGGYRLVGELDPNLYGVAGCGPLDVLRTLVVDLTNYRGEKLALEAHARAAAGLIRMMQRWPGVRDTGDGSLLLNDILEDTPGGGRAIIEVDEAGIYRMEYAIGDAN